MGGCLSNWNNNNITINISVDDKKNKKRDSSGVKAMEDMVNVITGKGELRQYTVPVAASQVLHSDTPSSSSSSSSTTDNNDVGWFLCNSDSLYYEEYIKALDVEEELEGGQIYFLLPAAKLDYPLTASDMAALAVKASLALQHATSTSTITSSKHQHRKIHHHKQQQQQQRNISSKKNNNNKARISPYFLLAAADDGDHEQQNQFTLSSSSSMMRKHDQSLSNNKSSSSKAHLGVSKSVRKLQRYSSTRAKLAVRSFRLRLTTIYEGSVLQFYS